MANRKRIFEKASIILTNYNNEEYIYKAIDSILEQDYGNIELIITDDCSKKFDKDKINNYIDKNKKNNIVNVDFIINDKNLGTVKTLNKALKKAKGDYILFFASDDKLANKHVLSNFSKVFKSKKYNIITSNWILCDSNLKPIKKYKSTLYLKIYNFINVKKLFARMCCSNIFGSGATCYRKEVFEKYGYINEEYKLLEDWPFWLSLLKNKERIYYANFDGLLHRTGGISESSLVTETKKQFFQEMLQTFNLEIIPNLSNFGLLSRFKIIRSYYLHIKYHEKYIDVCKEYETFNNLFDNKLIKILWMIDKVNPKILEKIKILSRFNKIVPMTFIITLILIIIIINTIIINKYFLIFLITLIYLIIYYFLSVIMRFIDIINIRKK